MLMLLEKVRGINRVVDQVSLVVESLRKLLNKDDNDLTYMQQQVRPEKLILISHALHAVIHCRFV